MLKQILQKYLDQPVRVTLYNSKARKARGKVQYTVGSRKLMLSSVQMCSWCLATRGEDKDCLGYPSDSAPLKRHQRMCGISW